MPRPHKPADLRTIRRLHDAAGSREELNRWIDAALKQGKRQAGREQYKETVTVGAITDLLESKGAARSALIRELVRENPGIRGVGTERSAIERIRRKLSNLEKQQHTSAWKGAFGELTALIRGTH
jgi:hypothetical protein